MLWWRNRRPCGWWIMRIRSYALLTMAAGLALAAFALRGTPAGAAPGPCGTTHDSLSAEEQEFLGLLQSWRNSHLSVSTTLQTSGALNAAAAWFAEWQVNNGSLGGHNDGCGRTWVQRSIDCGYSLATSGGQYYASGSGEGIWAVASSGNASVGPSQALAGMAGHSGSGIYAWTPSSPPFKCVGVGVARNTAGTAVAWVVIVAQYPTSQPCPGGTGGGGTSTVGTTATGSPTSTLTPTPTSTPSPTPTQPPTPTAQPGAPSVLIGAGWNLVSLPVGAPGQVLARAQGCYRVVYQFQEGQWRRYSPDLPAYANNLQTLSGGAFWIEGTAANCGLVKL